MICYVILYDPKSYRPVGEATPVKADSKMQAAGRVYGFAVEKAFPAVASVSAIAWAKSRMNGSIFAEPRLG